MSNIYRVTQSVFLAVFLATTLILVGCETSSTAQTEAIEEQPTNETTTIEETETSEDNNTEISNPTEPPSNTNESEPKTTQT
jgi:hypothetical protein